MVVGTPDVDDFVVTSLKLLKMVGNIRSKIGVRLAMMQRVFSILCVKPNSIWILIWI
jgi:hypothetical protein